MAAIYQRAPTNAGAQRKEVELAAVEVEEESSSSLIAVIFRHIAAHLLKHFGRTRCQKKRKKHPDRLRRES